MAKEDSPFPIPRLSSVALAKEDSPFPLFLLARDSCATSPESAGLTVAAATIASTCFDSMREARYSYGPSSTPSIAALRDSHVHSVSPKSFIALSAYAGSIGFR